MDSFKISDIQDLFAADLDRFVTLSLGHVTRLLAEDPPPEESLYEVTRQAHSLKGLAATVQAWGLASWGADLERLFEHARKFLPKERDRADAIFNFVLQHFNDWHVMNQFTVAEALTQAADHYQGLRVLMEEKWKDVLPPRDPRVFPASSTESAFLRKIARPVPLDLAVPQLQRKDSSASKPVVALPVAHRGRGKKSTPVRPTPPAVVIPQLRRAEAPTAPAPAPPEPSHAEATAPAAAHDSPAATSARKQPLLPRVTTPSLRRRVTSTPAADGSPAVAASAMEAAPAPAEAGADGDLLPMLAAEVGGYLEDLETVLSALATNLDDVPIWDKTRRLFHTIKGTAATFHLDAVSLPAKAAEARCIVALEDPAARTNDAFESCVSRAEAVATALQIAFDGRSLRASFAAAAPTGASASTTAPENEVVDADMVGFFTRDAADQIEVIEHAVLAWEKGENAREQVWAAQRGFHTIKGAANSIGLRSVANSVHQVEDYLESVAEAGGEGSAALFSFLLNCVDQLRTYLRDLSDPASADWVWNWGHAVRSLGAAGPERAEHGAPEAPAAPAAHSQPDEEHTIRIEAARLYQLMNVIGELVIDRARLDKKIEQLGQLHRSLTERNSALTDAVQSFQQQFEFNLLQDRTKRDFAPATPFPHPAAGSGSSEFTELEFDRYDQFNILARSLLEISHDIAQVNGDVASCLDAFTNENARFRDVSRHLQSQVTNLSLVPVDTLFARLERAFRDATHVEKKEADLVLEGGSALLDKVVVDKIYAPLLHLLRNAVAHGIEDSGTRALLKKAARGVVRLSTAQLSNQIVITISDDGGGVRPEAVYRRAVEKGWLPAGAPALTPEQVLHFIFQPGFSTSQKVTSVAGRGVGLDIVRKEIENLNGAVELRYEANVGSTWTLRLPLTLSISEAILAEGAGITFAFPMNFIEAGIILDAPMALNDNGREVYQVGDTTLPVIRLTRLLQLDGGAEARNGIIACVGDRRAIVTVDRVLARREIVVKQLDSLTARNPLLNGASLDAEGRIIPILNVPALLKFSEKAPAAVAPEAELGVEVLSSGPREFRVLIVDDSLSVRKVQERLLLDLGCKVTAAMDGLDALEKLRGAKFDFVFTDLEMPRMNGFELISEIHNSPTWNSLPIVVISSRGADKYITKALNLGANTFLSKPFTSEQLAQVLRFHGGWDIESRIQGSRSSGNLAA